MRHRTEVNKAIDPSKVAKQSIELPLCFRFPAGQHRHGPLHVVLNLPPLDLLDGDVDRALGRCEPHLIGRRTYDRSPDTSFQQKETHNVAVSSGCYLTVNVSHVPYGYLRRVMIPGTLGLLNETCLFRQGLKLLPYLPYRLRIYRASGSAVQPRWKWVRAVS